MKNQYRSFNSARKFTHNLKLKSTAEWRLYAKSGKRPDDIPTNPDKIYKNDGWIGMGDWLGTGFISTHDRKYRSFDDARKFVRSLGIKNQRDWTKYCKSGKLPKDIPHSPARPYKNKGWVNYGDWLGTGMIRHRDREYWSFEKARDYVQKLGLKNSKEWRKFTKSGKLPKEIPANPNQVYKNKGWISIGDWLGTGFVASYLREYWSFDVARDYVQKLGLKNKEDWERFRISGKKPKEIPSNPNTVYKKEWISFGDWLGTGTIATQNMKFRPIGEAKKFVHSLGLKNQKEWRKYLRSGKKPVDIPHNPERVYSKKRINKRMRHEEKI